MNNEEISSLTDLIPQNIWVWFPFNHNSQTARLPSVHIHILHDGFKLRGHYERIRDKKETV